VHAVNLRPPVANFGNGIRGMGKSPPDIEGAKRIMGALLRMPPKPHDEMKLGKRKAKPSKSPAKRKAVKK
jgi:hypothetical protein